MIDCVILLFFKEDDNNCKFIYTNKLGEWPNYL